MTNKKLNWALISDQHFGVRNDNKIFHRLYKDFYLNFFIPFLKHHEIKTLFILGDFFDRRKYINFETLKLSREIFFEPLKKMNVKIHAIVGNHDVMYKNTNSINSLDLLVNNHFYDNVMVYSSPSLTIIDDVKVLMLPWINSENYQQTVELVRNSDARFIFSHLELKGFEYHKGLISDTGHLDLDLLERYEFVFSGHYHHRSNRGNVYYLGSPYELTWADYNDSKGFYVFDGKNLKFIENPIKNFIQLDYEDENPEQVEKNLEALENLKDKFIKVIVKQRKQPILFERFIEKLEKNSPANIIIIDEFVFNINQKEIEINDTQDTLEIIKSYVYDDLKTNLSKEKILQKIQKLYTIANQYLDVE